MSYSATTTANCKWRNLAVHLVNHYRVTAGRADSKRGRHHYGHTYCGRDFHVYGSGKGRGYSFGGRYQDLEHHGSCCGWKLGIFATAANSPVILNAGDGNGFQTTPVTGMFLMACLPSTLTAALTQIRHAPMRARTNIIFHLHSNLACGRDRQGYRGSIGLKGQRRRTGNAPQMCVQLSWNGGAYVDGDAEYRDVNDSKRHVSFGWHGGYVGPLLTLTLNSLTAPLDCALSTWPRRHL